MSCGLPMCRWARAFFATAGLTVLAANSATAQIRGHNQPNCPPVPCLPPVYQPGTVPGTVPGTAPGTAPSTAAPETAAPDRPSQFAFEPESSALALSGGSASVSLDAAGYVDYAAPLTQFRLRYDSAYGNNRPDRAEFFYGKCGCFREAGLDPRAPGPPAIETSVDYQDIRPYLEYAFSKRFSAFIEAPVRFINPEQNANEAGFGNLAAGFKYAVVADPCQFLTFQFITTTPTGDAGRGLGNDLVSLEPGILWYRQLTDRLAWHNEVRDWIPIGGTDFQGNILRYGTALSYLAYNTCRFRVTPISEVVGWTLLSGKELAVANPGFPNGNANPAIGPVAAFATQDATGDTIINAKLGVRFGFGEQVGPANLSRSSLYIGYGRALTGDVWYRDMFRAEYSLRF